MSVRFTVNAQELLEDILSPSEEVYDQELEGRRLSILGDGLYRHLSLSFPTTDVMGMVRDQIVKNLFTAGDTGLPTEAGTLKFDEGYRYASDCRFIPDALQAANDDVPPVEEDGEDEDELLEA